MIDPDEEPTPRLEGPPEEPLEWLAEEPPAPPPALPEPPEGGLQRLVAVLIMVVTLLGAVFAFLQNAVGNRAARATRQSDIAAVEALAGLSRALNLISGENTIWDLAQAEGAEAESLLAAGGAEATALGWGSDAARYVLLGYTDLAGPQYQMAEGEADRARFAQESLAPAYRAAEYQKAYAAQRDGWGAKGGVFVVVITVLAVALFLIGLSRTSVAAASAPLLVVVGSAIAGVAAVWGFVVLARPVAEPSAEAIDAYVEGYVAFNSVYMGGDPERLEEGLTKAEESLTRAIAARPSYGDAYLFRGLARFRIGLYGLEGPGGFAGARDDYARLVALEPLNAVAWNNLAGCRFWLGDLAGAIDAISTSLRLDPDDLLANINLSAFLLASGDTAGYEAQLAASRDLVEGGGVTQWEMSYVAQEYSQVLGAAAAVPGADVALVERLRADLEALLGVDL